MRCRRSIVSATTGWLVAQPESVKVGTLPGGVAEVTGELAASVGELGAAGATTVVPVDDPIVPPREAIDTSVGSTRPNSWKAWAQSKRASMRLDTACSRCSRK